MFENRKLMNEILMKMGKVLLIYQGRIVEPHSSAYQ